MASCFWPGVLVLVVVLLVEGGHQVTCGRPLLRGARSSLWWGPGVQLGQFSFLSELPPNDRNGNLPLLSSLTHFAARLFSVRTGGFCEVRQTGNASPGGVRGRRGAGCGVILFVLVQMVTSSGIPLFGWCVGGSVVHCGRSFTIAAPSVWNSLPFELRCCNSLLLNLSSRLGFLNWLWCCRIEWWCFYRMTM